MTPAYSSHLLQPLDIGCFTYHSARTVGLLKRRCASGSTISINLISSRYTHTLGSRHKNPRLSKKIRSSWFGGFLSRSGTLKAQYLPSNPTPPVSRGSESSRNFTSRTPFTEKQLRQQASSIKALLRTGSRSPSSPSNCTINQLLKGCQLALQSATILAKENSELRTANEKQKQK